MRRGQLWGDFFSVYRINFIGFPCVSSLLRAPLMLFFSKASLNNRTMISLIHKGSSRRDSGSFGQSIGCDGAEEQF